MKFGALTRFLKSLFSANIILCTKSCFIAFTSILLCLFCRFLRSFTLSISTLSCYVKLLHKSGYLRNSRILGTWNLGLQRSNLRMIMLQSLQVFLLLVLLRCSSLSLIRSLNNVANFFYRSHCFLCWSAFTLQNYYIFNFFFHKMQRIYFSIQLSMLFMGTMYTRFGMRK